MTDGIQQKVLTVTAQAQALTITDQATYARAGEELLTWKDLRREIQGVFRPIISATHKSWQEALKQEAAFLKPIDAAYACRSKQMAAYLDQEAAQRAVLQASLTAQAEQQAEAAQVTQAATLEAEGRHEEAEAVLVAPPIMAPVILPPPQAEGVSWRMKHRAVVDDLMALIRAVAEGRITIEAVQANLPYLDDRANALKGLMNYPGVRVVEERVMVARGRP